MTKKLKITQVRSTIGYRERTRRTIEALGLGKINRSVVQQDNSAIRGMLAQVSHLVKVEEVDK
jgi:large subunit ribosomal protein L30